MQIEETYWTIWVSYVVLTRGLSLSMPSWMTEREREERSGLQCLWSWCRLVQEGLNNASLFLPFVCVCVCVVCSLCMCNRMSMCLAAPWTSNPEKNISVEHLETGSQYCAHISVCVCVFKLVWEFLGRPKLSLKGIRKRRRWPSNSNPKGQRSGPSAYVRAHIFVCVEVMESEHEGWRDIWLRISRRVH